MTLTIGLGIAIVLLVLINLGLATKLFTKHMPTTPALESMKSISKVYDIINDLVEDTHAYKVAISKSCYKCGSPYVEMIYDNKVTDEERYNAKFNRIPIDEGVVRELKTIAKGRAISANVSDWKSSLISSAVITSFVIGCLGSSLVPVTVTD